MIDLVGRTADQVFIPLTVGGGVRSVGDVDRLLRAGADKVSLNTAAIARPGLLAEAADGSAHSAWCCLWTPAGGQARWGPPRRVSPSRARSGAGGSGGRPRKAERGVVFPGQQSSR